MLSQGDVSNLLFLFSSVLIHLELFWFGGTQKNRVLVPSFSVCLKGIVCTQYPGHSFKSAACLLPNLRIVTALRGIAFIALILQVKKLRASRLKACSGSHSNI